MQRTLRLATQWPEREVAESGDSRAQGWESGAGRVIYFYGGPALPVFLLATYSKSDKGNLSKAERNLLATMTKSFLEDYGEQNE